MEDISITMGKSVDTGVAIGMGPIGDVTEFKAIIFKKGDIGEVVNVQTAKNGYFFAKKLDSEEVHEIPYAPAFIKFVGNDLETIRNLYEDSTEDFEF